MSAIAACRTAKSQKKHKYTIIGKSVMQKEAFTREGRTERVVTGVLSQVAHNPLLGLRLKAQARRNRKRSGIEGLDEVQRQAEEISAKAIAAINRITGAAIKPPKIEIETSPRKMAVLRGYFSYSAPDTIFITPLDAKGIAETATHESIHYARNKLIGWDTNYTTSKFSLKISIEEGVAVFIEQCINTKENGHAEGTILKNNDRNFLTTLLSAQLYSSIEEDLRSASRSPRFTTGLISGQFRSTIGPYAVGSAAIEILLLRNDLDLEKTALELLTHSNTEIIKRVVDAVSNDFDRKLKEKIDALLLFRTRQHANADVVFENMAKDIVLKKSLRDSLNSSGRVEVLVQYKRAG